VDWRSGPATLSDPESTWQARFCTGRTQSRASGREAGPSAAVAAARVRSIAPSARRRRGFSLDLSFRDMSRR
jgi:hypothetical protein